MLLKVHLCQQTHCVGNGRSETLERLGHIDHDSEDQVDAVTLSPIIIHIR